MRGRDPGSPESQAGDEGDPGGWNPTPMFVGDEGDPFLLPLLGVLGSLIAPVATQALAGIATSAVTGLLQRTFGGGSAAADVPLLPSSTGVTDPLAERIREGEFEEEEPEGYFLPSGEFVETFEGGRG